MSRGDSLAGINEQRVAGLDAEIRRGEDAELDAIEDAYALYDATPWWRPLLRRRRYWHWLSLLSVVQDREQDRARARLARAGQQMIEDHPSAD